MLSGEEFGLKYQTGLRYEVAIRKEIRKLSARLLTTIIRAGNPSIHIAKELTEGSEVMISLSRRVDRPNGRQLNPFVSFADSQNIQKGNPYLKPQFTNSYEAGYSITTGKTSVTSTLFYRASSGVISSITTIGDHNVATTTWANLDKTNSYGSGIYSRSTISAVVEIEWKRYLL